MYMNELKLKMESGFDLKIYLQLLPTLTKT